MNDFDLTLFALIVQSLPDLLRDHPYGLYELANAFSSRFKLPIYEILTPLTEALQTKAQTGEVVYNPDINQVCLTSCAVSV